VEEELQTLRREFGVNTPVIPVKFLLDLNGIDLRTVIDVEKCCNGSLEQAARMIAYDTRMYEYSILAGRLMMEAIHRVTPSSVRGFVEEFKTRLTTRVLDFFLEHAETIDAFVDHERDFYDVDFFSASTTIKTYLARCINPLADAKRAKLEGDDGDVNDDNNNNHEKHDDDSVEEEVKKHFIERPQYLALRVATHLWADDGIDKVLAVYDQMSRSLYTHASPTLFNAGFRKGQLTSCFLMTIDDSLDSIMKHLWHGATISKFNGGLGYDVSRVRHSEIGAYGFSKGVVPMLQMFNAMVRYVDQLGKRRGAAAFYLDVSHTDIYDFTELSLRRNDMSLRAHDINTGVLIHNLFMQRVVDDGNWTLFCPAKTPKLADLYGDEWTEQYLQYEKHYALYGGRVVKARDLDDHISQVEIETGIPYRLDIDQVNLKTPQRNLGKINSSNLCMEIVEYSSETEIPSCNLASISIPKFVRGERGQRTFDFAAFMDIARQVCRNINKVIDHNYYPEDDIGTGEKIRQSNNKHRPIAIGVTGMYDACMMMDYPMVSDDARRLNRLVWAAMYYACLDASNELAVADGAYPSFYSVHPKYGPAPMSLGELQHDMWVKQDPSVKPVDPTEFGVNDPGWNNLRQRIVKHGTRNSLVTAMMPTATTSQRQRNTEMCEAPLTNLYVRNVMSGNYVVLNRHLYEDLHEMGLWIADVIEFIKSKRGSVQGLTECVRQIDAYIERVRTGEAVPLSPMPMLPASTTMTAEWWDRLNFLETKYKTMWEISQKIFVEMAHDRALYIDQTQSFNVYLPSPTVKQVRAVHLMTWRKKFKSQLYYLRSRAAVDPIPMTVDDSRINAITGKVTVAAAVAVADTSSVVVVERQLVRSDSSYPIEEKAQAFYCTKEEGCLMCQ
jgi:ribonucleoside-diphosphate reductase alpha subunit